MKRLCLLVALVGLSIGVTGCAKIGNSLNPFAEELPPVAYKGTPNDHALRSEGDNAGEAREALQRISQYPRAHAPQPYNPVIQPAVVRMLWVPDHLNPHGDLVPSHYYYLKVLDDQWAVTDVFEKRDLISQGGGRGSQSNIPYTINQN